MVFVLIVVLIVCQKYVCFVLCSLCACMLCPNSVDAGLSVAVIVDYLCLRYFRIVLSLTLFFPRHPLSINILKEKMHIITSNYIYQVK